jgi:hypothetical protein
LFFITILCILINFLKKKIDKRCFQHFSALMALFKRIFSLKFSAKTYQKKIITLNPPKLVPRAVVRHRHVRGRGGRLLPPRPGVLRFQRPAETAYATAGHPRHVQRRRTSRVTPGDDPTKSYKYWFTNICN